METTSDTKRSTTPDLARYRNLHLWMLLPLAITALGFASRYFMALPQATFHQHVHGISASLLILSMASFLPARWVGDNETLSEVAT